MSDDADCVTISARSEVANCFIQANCQKRTEDVNWNISFNIFYFFPNQLWISKPWLFLPFRKIDSLFSLLSRFLASCSYHGFCSVYSMLKISSSSSSSSSSFSSSFDGCVRAHMTRGPIVITSSKRVIRNKTFGGSPRAASWWLMALSLVISLPSVWTAFSLSCQQK